jgi:magnesium-transporting ATPase (P-type)
LNAQEQQVFQSEIARIEPVEREEIMEIVTSWMEQGSRQVIIRQLTSLLDEIPETLQDTIENLPNEKLETLALALLRFRTLNDLENWLQEHQD